MNTKNQELRTVTSAKFKFAAFHHSFELGEDVEYVSREIVYGGQIDYLVVLFGNELVEKIIRNNCNSFFH